MSKTQNQHYVPKFYLHGFTNGNAQLSVYNRETQRYKDDYTPKGIAYETGLYKVEMMPDKNGKPHELEELFCFIENACAPIFEKIARREDLTHKDREALAVYVASQYLRTPGNLNTTKEQMEGMHATMMNMALEIWATNPKALASQNKEAVSRGMEPLTRESIQKVIDGGGVKSKAPKGAYVKQNMEMITPVARGWLEGSWIISQVPDGCALITSDHPVCLFGDRGGTANPGTLIVFPINKKQLLVIQNNNYPTAIYDRCNKKIVRIMNEVIAESSHKYIIGSDRKLVERNVKRADATNVSTKKRHNVKRFGPMIIATTNDNVL